MVDLNGSFGGVCSETGEGCVDLNRIDMSLEGSVPASVAAGIFDGTVDAGPYRSKPVVSGAVEEDPAPQESSQSSQPDAWDFQGMDCMR
jgi:hypothetical protein